MKLPQRASKPTPQELESRLRGLAAAVDQLANGAQQAGETEHQQALRRQRDAQQEVDQHERRAPAQIDDAVRKSVASLSSTVGPVVESLAPGLASMPPDAAEWWSREFIGAGIPQCLRIGTLDAPGTASVPAVLPLLDSAGWWVTADHTGTGRQAVQSAAVRLVGCAEPMQLRIDTFDPLLSGVMGLLGNLTSKASQVVPRALHTGEELRNLLATLVTTSSSRASRLAQLGLSSFAEMGQETQGGLADPHRIAVLLDYPSGIDARSQAELVRLAATAASRGIGFLIHYDPTIKPEYGVDPAELANLLDSVTLTADAVDSSRLPDAPVRLDPPFDPRAAAAICDLVADLSERAVLPTADFVDTLPDRAQWWQSSGDELRTVIGYDDRTPALLRLRSGNPPLPHVLVGGAVGQGKSNLLLVLLHGLAVRYSPAELEMYLLDFKHGLEFSALGPTGGREHWLPHVKVLGVHSDRPFGLAVLQHLAEEMTRRSDVFKAIGNVADISDLPPGVERPARILVMLDEFQVLLQKDDDVADEAAKLIESLVRLGRAYGVHVVLATQTIDGLQRLATRRDSIFGQVPYRIAFKTTPSDSQAILRTGNSAAADLQFRGEAILNSNFGSPDDNQRVLISFTDKETLDQLRHDLWSKAGDVRPPRTFHQDESAGLVNAVASRPPPAGPDVVRAWVGMPIAVDETPTAIEVRGEPGAGLLVLGDGPQDALGVLSAAAVSAAMAASTPPRVILLDGLASDESLAENKAALVSTLQNLGCDVVVADRAEQVYERVFELRDLCVSGAAPDRQTYVLGIGMHGIPRMTAHAEGRFESPATALQQLVKEGPGSGVVMFAWWNRLHVCTEQLGFGRSNVAAHLFLRHPQDGVRSVCGPLVRWNSERHRGLLWDGMSAEPQTFVPFAPVGTADVGKLTQAVYR